MLNRISLHVNARCVHNNQAGGLPPALKYFYKQLAQGLPAIIWPTDWPANKRQAIAKQLKLGQLPNDIFYIGFTSGSTGTPKAFYRNHQSWLASFEALGPPPRSVLTTGDLSHSLHLFAGVYACHVGCTFYSYDRFSVASIAQQLTQVDWLFTTPAQLRALARLTDNFPQVNRVYVSGAALNGSDMSLCRRLFPIAHVHQFYGASETSFIAIADQDTPPGSVGKPADIGVDIRFDHEQRIWVRSPMNFSGYLLPKALPAGEWVTVDDCGYQDARGYLYVQGRIQRMINSAGLNIYPEEIEAALRLHSGVKDAIVIGLPCPLRGEKLAALVASDHALSALALTEFLQDKIGKHSLPKVWKTVAQLPYNRAGKADMEACLELFSHTS